MPKANKPLVMERPCYTLAVVDGASAELTMYGEIVETQPTDWWGDPIPSQNGFVVDRVVDGKIVEHSGSTETFETFWTNGLIKPV